MSHHGVGRCAIAAALFVAGAAFALDAWLFLGAPPWAPVVVTRDASAFRPGDLRALSRGADVVHLAGLFRASKAVRTWTMDALIARGVLPDYARDTWAVVKHIASLPPDQRSRSVPYIEDFSVLTFDPALRAELEVDARIGALDARNRTPSALSVTHQFVATMAMGGRPVIRYPCPSKLYILALCVDLARVDQASGFSLLFCGVAFLQCCVIGVTPQGTRRRHGTSPCRCAAQRGGRS